MLMASKTDTCGKCSKVRINDSLFVGYPIQYEANDKAQYGSKQVLFCINVVFVLPVNKLRSILNFRDNGLATTLHLRLILGDLYVVTCN